MKTIRHHHLLLLTISFLFVSQWASAQDERIGMGTTTPDSNAVLDIQSADKGMLLPRLTTAERDAISSPAAGLIIYNTTDSCFNYYSGAAWVKNCGRGLNADAVQQAITGGEGAIHISEGNDITMDPFGNTLVTGEFFKSATFGSTVLTSSAYDVFLVKYDAAGNVVWAKKGGGKGVSTDALGNVYVTGSTGIVRKYDPSGNVLWTNQGGGTKEGISADADGNVYVTGSFTGTATFDTETLSSAGAFDVFVVKYDTNGNLVWAQQGNATGGAEGHAINTDASGNVFVTGYFGNTNTTVTFDTTVLTSVSLTDVFVVKYDADGIVVWAKNEGGTYNDFGNGIDTDTSGNVYVTGTFSYTATFGDTTLTNTEPDDVFVVKYDASGNVLWAKQGSGGGSDASKGISTDAAGNAYVAGYFEGTVTFGSTVLTSVGLTDVFVVKYDAAGNELWAKQGGGTFDDFGNGITTDADGNAYLTGSFISSATFESTTLTGGPNYANVFMVKYDASGSLVSAQQDNGPTGAVHGLGVVTDAFDNIFVTGYFTGTITLGNTELASAGLEDIFVMKYDAAGNFRWAVQGGGTGYDRGQSIDSDAAGNTYVVGHFQDTATFGSTMLTSAGGTDVFMVKYGTTGDVLWAKQGSGTDDNIGNGISLDASDNIFITGSFKGTAAFGSSNLTSSGNEDVFVVKYDAAGTVLWAEKGSGSKVNIGTDISTDASGNVFVTGHSYGSLTFGSITTTNPAGPDVFVVKYDAAGNAQWVNQEGGPYSSSLTYGESLSTDASGNILVTGRFYGNYITFGTTVLNFSTVFDLFVAKYDTAGNLLWVKQGGGNTSDSGYGIGTDAMDNVYVTGDFSGTITFGSTVLTSGSGRDAFVVKYDNTGSAIWVKQGGVTSSAFGKDITTDNAGNAIVIGSYDGVATFEPLTLNGAGGDDLFLLKYTPDGDLGTFSPSNLSNSQDEDTDPTNENISGAYLSGTDLTINEGNNSSTVDLSALQGDDADADPTNELLTTAALNGTDLEITDAGGTSTVDLSSVPTTDADIDPTNELQNLALVLTEANSAGSLAITDLADPTNAQDAATKNYVDSNDDVDDADADPTNEIQDLSQILAEDNSAASSAITDLADPTDAQDAATKNYVDSLMEQYQLPTTVGPLALAGTLGLGSLPRSVAVQGNLACIVNDGTDQLEVVDISDPANPSLSGTLAIGTAPISVAVQGTHAYIANNGNDQLEVVDISNPASPMLAGSLLLGTNPRAVAVSGSYAYVGNSGSNLLEVVDISNPAVPVLAGSVSIGFNPTSVAVQGSYAYIANTGSDQLEVVDISTPSSPLLVGTLGVGNDPRGVAVQGGYAYVANTGNDLFEVVDVSTPASPNLAGSLSIGSNPRSVAVQGTYAYVANHGNDKLEVIDISDPANPVLAAELALGTVPQSVAVLGGHAYIANSGNDKLEVVDLIGSPTIAVDETGQPVAGAWGQNSVNTYVQNHNVGIGTTSPAALLHVNGTSQFEGASTFNDSTSFLGSINTNNQWLSGDGDGEGIYINDDGKVGIGENSPAHELHLTSTAQAGLRVESTNTSTPAQLILSRGSENWTLKGAPTGTTDLRFDYNGTAKFTLHSNGNATLVGTLTQNSDRRLKHHIRPLSGALTRLHQLRGYTYHWKEAYRPEGTQIGLIAQEVQAIYPMLVAEDENGLLSVNYIGLIPVLLEATKAQQQEIEAQAAGIGSLQSRFAKMEELKTQLSEAKAAMAELETGEQEAEGKGQVENGKE